MIYEKLFLSNTSYYTCSNNRNQCSCIIGVTYKYINTYNITTYLNSLECEYYLTTSSVVAAITFFTVRLVAASVNAYLDSVNSIACCNSAAMTILYVYINIRKHLKQNTYINSIYTCTSRKLYICTMCTAVCTLCTYICTLQTAFLHAV